MDGKDFWKAFAAPLGLLVLFTVAIWGVYGLSTGLTKVPKIDLITATDIVTDQAEVPVTGVVHNTSDILINGKQVYVGKDGGFSTVIPVGVGENKVEIVAGKKTVTKASIKIVREQVSKATSSAATAVNSDNLATSGPLESVMGAFGAAAIVFSGIVFAKSRRQNALQNA